MCQPGDQLFVGRYLVNGADQSSLYLEVLKFYLLLQSTAQSALIVYSPSDWMLLVSALLGLSACVVLLVQVKDVRGQEVVCIAQNDSLLDGLLTLIHQERSEEFGMSSFQASLTTCRQVGRSVV